MTKKITQLKEEEKAKLHAPLVIEVESLKEGDVISAEPQRNRSTHSYQRVGLDSASTRKWTWIAFLVALVIWTAGFGVTFNWFALLLIIPAGKRFFQAYDTRQALGQLPPRMEKRLNWGLVMGALGVMWGFGLSASFIFPALLIGWGVKSAMFSA